MNKNIVLEPSSDLRTLARKCLAGQWKTAILTVLLMEVVTQGPVLLLSALFPSGALGVVLNLYSVLVSGPVALGMTMVFLNLCRAKQTSPIELFYGFEYLFKAIGLQIVIGFFTLLWSLLFVIPGIIAAYRYSLAFYILADDPQKGIMQCIGESKYLMAGNKAKAFCLDLSFIGWSLLCSIPVGIFTMAFTMGVAMDMIRSGMTEDQIMLAIQQMPSFQIGLWIASIGYLLLSPYMTAAQICLYDLINGNLVIRRVGPGEGAPSQDFTQQSDLSAPVVPGSGPAAPGASVSSLPDGSRSEQGEGRPAETDGGSGVGHGHDGLDASHEVEPETGHGAPVSLEKKETSDR